jgi:hypothetical protein
MDLPDTDLADPKESSFLLGIRKHSVVADHFGNHSFLITSGNLFDWVSA